MADLDDVNARLSARLVRRTSGCLEWTGTTIKGGYGHIKVEGKMVATHRLAWSLANGPIPPGIHVLHRCDNPPCCDPMHLFLGTDADNVADKIAKGRDYNQRKTHCPQSHPYDEKNTRIAKNGGRVCRTCQAQAQQRFRDRRKASA